MRIIILAILIAINLGASDDGNAQLMADIRRYVEVPDTANYTSVIERLSENDRILIGWFEEWAKFDKKKKSLGLDLVTNIWTKSPLGMKSKKWIFSESVILFLVMGLEKGQKDCCQYINEVLTTRVPDNLIRKYSERIMKVSETSPYAVEIRLLAKVGDKTMIDKIIDQRGPYAGLDILERKILLAKIGDESAAADVRKIFLETTVPSEKVPLIQALGYIGRHQDAILLAKEVRNKQRYNTGGVRVPIRNEVINALSNIFPCDDIFWDCNGKGGVDPVSDEDGLRAQIEIEKWLTKNLGVTYDGPPTQPTIGIDVLVPLPEP